ncbi:MAG: glycosyltransferase [Rhodobacteraceae bacterium]|nr:glycosyltransferase [Paracoccaceae bacterium]
MTIPDIAVWIATIIIFSGLLQSFVYFMQIFGAAYVLMTIPPVGRSNLLWRRYSEVFPPISIIVPAYNESAGIVETVRSLVALQYPTFEIIVVNDGSRDATLDKLVDAFEMELLDRPYESAIVHEEVRGIYGSKISPKLTVVDKVNGGKADALNAGINVCRTPVLCAVDGDSILEPDALMRVAHPFIEDPVRTVAVGGTVRIANGSRIRDGRVIGVRLPRSILALFQVVEYLRAFLMARLAWSGINALMLISGAFGVFRRKELVAVGGFAVGSVGEDLDMIVKLHKYMIEQGREYKIAFVPEPVCWTEVPEDLNVLSRQRTRWQRGALEVFFRYRSMLFNPRYGRIGFLGFGNILIVDVMGPVLEVLGYVLMPLLWGLGLLDIDYLVAFTALVFVFGVFVSVASLVLEELELRRFKSPRDLIILLCIAIIENFGYRQLNNFWRVRGWWQYLRSNQEWGEMHRKGLASH